MKHFFSFISFILFINAANWAQGITLFNDSYLHEIRFENIDTMIFINSENYQSVKMTFDGTLINAVGVKQKGNISASHGNNKMPLKVKTNKYVSGQEYDGIREFTLNNSFQDPSMMREKMTYDMAGELGLYTLRTAYAKVYMDNIYWGVYTIVEGKDEMYKHVFGNKDGDAIESTDFGNLCYYGANKSDYAHSSVDYRYIIDNGDETTAWSRFITMLDKANNSSNTNYQNLVSPYLNISDFARYQAMNVYLLNSDSYIGEIGNQLYFYDNNAALWQVIPWDFNASFGLWNTSNFTPTGYPIIPNRIANGCVAKFINTNATVKSYYLNTMCDLTTNFADTTNLNSIIDQWKNQIKTAVYADWRKDFTNNDFDNSTEYGYFAHNSEIVPALKTFAKDRYETITQALSTINYTCASSAKSFNQIEKSLVIFPNPVQGLLYLKWQNETITKTGQKIRYEIWNIHGQLMQSDELTDFKIDINSLQSGVFVLKCFGEKGNTAVQTFIK